MIAVYRTRKPLISRRVLLVALSETPQQHMQRCTCRVIAIDTLHPTDNDEIPVISLCDLPAERWPGEESSGSGWYRMFAGFAALMLVTVLVGLLLNNRDGARNVRGWDGSVARWIADHRPSWLSQIAGVASLAGSAAVLITGALVTGILVWRRTQRSGPSLLPLLALADTQVVVQVAKRIVARPRPARLLASTQFDGYAWPSGHAASATAVAVSAALIVAALGCSAAVRRRVRWAAGLVAASVAISRIVLGAHWTTDVVMGMVVGAAVAALLAGPLLADQSGE